MVGYRQLPVRMLVVPLRLEMMLVIYTPPD